MDRIEKAYCKYKAAAEDYIKAVAAEYPIGMILTLKKGNVVFQGEVVRHSDCWYSSPGTFLVRNTKTLKLREVSRNNVLK